MSKTTHNVVHDVGVSTICWREFFETSGFQVVWIQGISMRGLGICGPTVVLLSTRYFVCGLSMDMTHAPDP